jgi:hypothetical protein
MHSVHWLFVGNVLSHLVASMSGIVSFGIAIYEAAKKKKFETWAFFAIGLICLTVAFDQAWQDEHRNGQAWESQRNLAYQERDFWKDQSYQKDAALRSRDQLLAQNYTALIGEQGSANQTQISLTKLSDKILDIGKPEKQQTTFLLHGVNFAENKGKHYLEAILLTNKSISPVRVLVTCENGLASAQAHVQTQGGAMNAIHTARVDEKTFDLEISSPPWSPVTPLLIDLFYDADTPGRCGYRLM